jgi:hypothetical protein
MRYKLLGGLLAFAAMAGSAAVPASAALFWSPPDFSGSPVSGAEPGLGIALPGATEKELQAHLLWNMRAGLNVAALQCQFSPVLLSVRNYNDLLRQHGAELTAAYTTIGGYFKRMAGKAKGNGWQTALDQYTTKTYNGFSTLHAQLGFCETAGAIGREALDQPKGSLYLTARARMREFRNSLIPQSDRLFGGQLATIATPPLPPLNEDCWDKKDVLRKKCATLASL